MRERFDVQACVYMTESMQDKIKDAARRLNVSFSEVVRECVQNDLTKLLDRETKRTKRRTQ